MSYEDPIPTYYEEVVDQKVINYTIDKIEPNESKILSYEVRVKKDTQEGTNITNKATIEYNGIKQETNQIVNLVKQGSLQVILQPIDILEDADPELYKQNQNYIEEGITYRYMITVTNNSSQELKNIEISINTSEHYDTDISYDIIGSTNELDVVVQEKTNTTCIIDSIPANGIIYIPINTVISNVDNNKRTYMSVKATVNENSYRSNYYEENVQDIKVEVKQSSPNENQFVNPGDTIEYTITVKNTGTETLEGLIFYDTLSDYVTLKDIRKDGSLLTCYEEIEIPEGQTAPDGYYYVGEKIEYYLDLLERWTNSRI